MGKRKGQEVIYLLTSPIPLTLAQIWQGENPFAKQVEKYVRYETGKNGRRLSPLLHKV